MRTRPPHIGFPRLYVAASLKHGIVVDLVGRQPGFPRLYVAASLKPDPHRQAGELAERVFRGFMSRPH